jgi:glycosyltransferase involved in cell wall biosynthesis
MVLSSRYEGFANVLGEAMAAGLPVVAFNCDFGPAEMVDNLVDGLLVPDGDAGALAAALDRIMGDAALRMRLGIAARQSATRFASPAIIEQWDRLVDDVRAVAGA